MWKCGDTDGCRSVVWMGQGAVFYYFPVYFYTGDSDAAPEI